MGEAAPEARRGSRTGTPLYVGPLPGISAGKDLHPPEVARCGLLADAARARGSAIRATDGMLGRLPARRGQRRAARAVDRHVARRRPPPGMWRRRGWRDPLHRGRAAEEPMAMRILRWRETDSNHRFLGEFPRDVSSPRRGGSGLPSAVLQPLRARKGCNTVPTEKRAGVAAGADRREAGSDLARRGGRTGRARHAGELRRSVALLQARRDKF